MTRTHSDGDFVVPAERLPSLAGSSGASGSATSLGSPGSAGLPGPAALSDPSLRDPASLTLASHDLAIDLAEVPSEGAAAALTPAGGAAFRRRRRAGLGVKLAVMGLTVPGLVTGVALPSYAAVATNDAIEEAAQRAEPTPLEQAAAEKAEALAAEEAARAAGQSMVVSSDVEATTVARDDYGVTDPPPPPPPVAPAAASAGGASVAGLLADPPQPAFSLSAVVDVAMQYQGTPYRFAGADPSGFDCSGFTQFVYANFGISLPHSGAAQAAMGTPIDASAAQPGDIVVIDGGSHVGIYAGGNSMIDAPYEGKTVGVHDIYSANHYFVRVGI